MARMALGIVGSVVGNIIAPGIGGVIGGMVGGLAGGLIDQMWMGGSQKGVKASDVAVQVSTYGHPINKIWGSEVIAGDLIWVGKRHKREKQVSSKGGFGGSGSAFTVYRQSFMVGLCEAPVCDVLKIWADAKLIYDKTGKSKAKQRYSSLKIRFYYGGAEQLPDELIEAERGIGLVPAFRHLCAIMFENLPLRDYGNRVPNIRALVVTKCATDAKHTVDPLITGFNGVSPGGGLLLGQDTLVPDRGGQSFVYAAGRFQYPDRTWLYKIDVAQGKIALQSQAGYIYGMGGLPDTGIDGFYYNSEDRDPETCHDLNLTGHATAIAKYPLETLWREKCIRNREGKPHDESGDPTEAMGTGSFRVNQLTKAGYHWETGDLHHVRVDRFYGAVWQEKVVDDTLTGTVVVRDIDGDDADNIWILRTTTGGAQLYNGDGLVYVLDNTTDLTNPKHVRWIPADNTLLIASDTKIIKWDIASGATIAHFTWPDGLHIANNSQSWHGNITSTNTLWFGTVKRDITVDLPEGATSFYFPLFLELNTVTLTVIRQEFFTEIAPQYPPSSNASFFSPDSALYFPEQNAIVAQEGGGDRVVGIFRMGTMHGACPTLQEVVEDICISTKELTLAQLDATALADDLVCGFLNDNQRPARELLEVLSSYYFFDMRERDGKLEFLKRTGTSVVTIPIDDLDAHEEGESSGVDMKETRQQEIELPRDVQVLFVNPDRDYEQDSVQEIRNARVVKTTERATLNAPIVFTQPEAKRIVSIRSRELWVQRSTYEFRLALPYQRLDVLDVVEVQLADESSRILRLTQIDEGANGLLECKGVDHHPGIYTDLPEVSGAPGGGHTGTVIPENVWTDLYLMDTPLMHDSDDGPVFYFAVTPANDAGKWGGAEVVRSIDQGVTWDDFSEQAVSAIAGRAQTVLAAPDAWTVWDEVNTVDVKLTLGELFESSKLDVLSDANGAMLGNEMIQFVHAVLVNADENIWRLSTLLRGRRGTEWAIGTHTVSEQFVMLSTDGVKRVTVPLSDFNVRRDYRAISADMTIEDSTQETLTWRARSLQPYAVAQPHVVRLENGDILITWNRRSRIGVAWASGADPSLAEASEAYEVDVFDGTTLKGMLTTSIPSVLYTTALQATHGVTTNKILTLSIYQKSASVGRGFATTVRYQPGTITVIPPLPRPDAPTIAVTVISSTAIDVEITSPDPGVISGHTVQYSLTGTSGWTSAGANLGPIETIFHATGLTPATLYYFRARDFHATDSSDWSNIDSDTTDTAPVLAPNAPSLLSVAAASPTRIDGTFTDNSGNETSFDVHRSVSGGAFTLRLSLAANVTTFSDTGLTPSTLYAYKVLAKNVAGSSSFSNTDSDTTDAPPIIVGENTWFVSTTGSATGTGNILSPFRSHAQAYSHAKPGDVIYDRGGTYTERIDPTILPVTFGTSWATAITIANYNGETVTWKPANSTASVLNLTYTGRVIQYLIYDGIILDGFAVDGTTRLVKFVINLDGAGFHTQHINHIRIANCQVKGSSWSGMLTGRGAEFLEILSTRFHHNGTSNQLDHGLYLESSGCLIDDCEFDNNAASGMQIYTGWTAAANGTGINDTCNNNIIRRSLSHDNCFGFILGSGDNNRIESSIAHSQTIGASGSGYGIALYAGPVGCTNGKIWNCTSYGNAGEGIQNRPGCVGSSLINNISFGNSGTQINTYSTVLAAFINNMTSDPDFADAGAGDFHLLSTSDAIDSGSSLSVVTTDYYGTTRPQSGVMDRGAAEYTP